MGTRYHAQLVHDLVLRVGLACAVLPLSANAGLTLSSTQDGMYDTVTPDPWGGAGNPGDANGNNDECTINSGHTVRIEDNDGGTLSEAKSDTITVAPGGTLYAVKTEYVFAGTTNTLAGGTLKYNHYNSSLTVGGNFLVTADSILEHIQTYDGSKTGTTTFGDLAFGSATVTFTVTNTHDTKTQTSRFTGATVTNDVTLDVGPYSELILDSLVLDDAATLVKTPAGSALRINGNNSPLNGTIVCNGGSLYCGSSYALDGAAVTMNAGTLTVQADHGLNDATATLNAGSRLYAADVDSVFAGATITLAGGTMQYANRDQSRTVGGDVVVTADSLFVLTQGYDSFGGDTTSFGSLAFEPGGHTLSVTNTHPNDIQGAIFTNSVIENSATLAFKTGDQYPRVTLDDLGVRRTETVTKTGGGVIAVSGDVWVEMPGSAALAASTNVTLVNLVGGSLDTGSAAYQGGGLWTFDDTSSLVAYATNRVAAVPLRSAVTFDPEDAGMVCQTGLPIGEEIQFSIGVTNFGGGSVHDVVAELQANTNITEVTAADTDLVTFLAIPTATEMYFIWDNANNTLGAEVFSFHAAPPPRGSVFLLR